MLVASNVNDNLNGRDAQVGVDHCIGDIPWGRLQLLSVVLIGTSE